MVAVQGDPTDRPPPAAEEPVDAADGLVQLARLVQGAFARIADRHHLTPVQARLLCVLAQGPRGMTELARCCGVEKAALTGLVDRAERRGLAGREPVPGDRRALRVTLTETGRRAAAAFHDRDGQDHPVHRTDRRLGDVLTDGPRFGPCLVRIGLSRSPLDCRAGPDYRSRWGRQAGRGWKGYDR